MKQAVEVSLVVAIIAAATYLGFRPTYGATPAFWLIAGVPSLVIASYACLRLGLDGELARLLRPDFGDITRGFAVAALLYLGAVVVAKVVAQPGTPREAWLVRVYLQLGEPALMRAHLGAVGFCVLAVSAAEEIVWRGLVTRALSERLGGRRGWQYAAVLYALAQAPSAFVLADRGAGPNPLIVIGALGVGLGCGALARSTGRLVAAIIAHAALAWCLLVPLRLWGVS